MGLTTQLTPPELLHLSLHASENDQPDKALEHLKHLLSIEPENAKAIYMMGALHAEIGMYEQAVDELRRASELDDSLITARFQLGLLLLTQGVIDEAEDEWRKLDHLGSTHALVLFKRGMLHLVNDEFEECASALEAGISANNFNEDLNRDMERVLNDARNAQPQAKVSSEREDEKPASSGHSLLMNAYGHDDTEH